MPIITAATPRAFAFEVQSTALLVIDMQHDFLSPDGWAAAAGLDITQLTPCIPVIKNLLTQARESGLHIIHTREGYRPDLADCPPRKLARYTPQVGATGPKGRYMITGQPCNDIIAPLAPLAGETIIDKPGAGAFHATLLDQILRLKSITHLIICGVTADVCVNTTIREANDRGYECLLIEDATAAYDPSFTQAVIDMLRIGIAGATTTSTHLQNALT